mgnify:FL=1
MGIPHFPTPGIVHEFQPLDTVQGLCLHPQPVEVVEQVVLDVVQTGLDLRHALAGHTKGQVFALGQAIVALGQLPPDEQKILKRILSKSPNIKNSPFNFRRKRK